MGFGAVVWPRQTSWEHTAHCSMDCGTSGSTTRRFATKRSTRTAHGCVKRTVVDGVLCRLDDLDVLHRASTCGESRPIRFSPRVDDSSVHFDALRPVPPSTLAAASGSSPPGHAQHLL